MKILLLGEYSNVHNTLAEGLRALGHKVVVASNGDFWKNYPRDIDLSRQLSFTGRVSFLYRLLKALPKMRGYDIVQLINPMFLELKAAHLFPIYRYLRRHNRRVVLGAFGMDWIWVKVNTTLQPLRYSDFNIGTRQRTNADAIREQQEWIGTDKERLNKMIADDCDAIVAGLYEYLVCYQQDYVTKTTFIPFPIRLPETLPACSFTPPLKLFIGINRTRSEYKGTDVMLRAAERIVNDYPDRVVLQKAISVPFNEYQCMVEGADAILDQLYSYTPSMNPLMAMSKGVICIGGGEPENYEVLDEHELRPIVNVLPEEEDVYQQLKKLVLHPEQIAQLKTDSITYIARHHDHIKVARRYEALYRSLLGTM